MSPAAALREHALALLSDDEHSPDAARLRALLSEPLVVPVLTRDEALLGTLRALLAIHALDVRPAVGVVAILDRAEADAVPA